MDPRKLVSKPWKRRGFWFPNLGKREDCRARPVPGAAAEGGGFSKVWKWKEGGFPRFGNRGSGEEEGDFFTTEITENTEGNRLCPAAAGLRRAMGRDVAGGGVLKSDLLLKV